MQENQEGTKHTNQSNLNSEQLFESKLLAAICKKLIDLGEISAEEEFLESYPKENLADVHNQEAGAYYLMSGEQPVKLVEYNLKTFEVFEVSED